MQSVLDLSVAVYRLLNASAVTGLISPGQVWRHNRPRNSPYMDVVVNTPEFRGKSYLDINVHSPNIGEYEPLTADDSTFPDLARMREVVNTIIGLLPILEDYSFTVMSAGTPIRDEDGHWFANIRCEYVSPLIGETHEVVVSELSGIPDGFGGSIPQYNPVWAGTASRQSIERTPNLNIINGRYEVNLSCEWVLPGHEVTVERNMRILAPDGEYAINGIRPEGSLWIVNAARMDALNVSLTT